MLLGANREATSSGLRESIRKWLSIRKSSGARRSGFALARTCFVTPSRCFPLSNCRSGGAFWSGPECRPHGTSLFSPVQIPDLMGVKDRRYLDHTGLMLHRGPADLMRYAALNQGADMLSDYMGYHPTAFVQGADAKDDNVPPPETQQRYS